MAARAAALGIDPRSILLTPADEVDVLRRVLEEAEEVYIDRLEQWSARIAVDVVNTLAKATKR